MSSFIPDDRAYIRWDTALYIELYAAAHPLIEQGHDLVDALAVAQAELPERLHRDQEGLTRIATKSRQLREAIKLYERLSPDARAELVRRLRVRGDTVEALPDGHRVFWKDWEEALVDRRILYMRINLGDQRNVWYQLDDAQRMELPRERWRSMKSLKSPQGHAKINARLAQPGRLHECEKLLKGYPPFDPCKRPLTTDEALATEERQGAPQPEEVVLPPKPQLSPAAKALDVVLVQIAPPPESVDIETLRDELKRAPPPTLLDLVKAHGYTPDQVRPRQLQEPAPAIQAPQASPTPEKTPGGPMGAVAGQLVGLITSLFDAVATHHAAHAANEYRRISEQVTSAAVEAIDARLQELVPQAVAKVMEEMLGPGATPPEVDLPPLKLDLSGAGLPARVKLDVVGLFPRQVAEVKKALNGYADTVRFIDPDKVNGDWVPRDVVIASSKVASRVVDEKCRKAHAHVHRVWGSATSVVNAVREIYAGRGVELH
jgi:hypothetical protein